MQRLKSISAPGKIVLCGEYAVLEGARATACAFQRRAYLRWSAGDTTPEIEACLRTAAQDQIVPAPFHVDVSEFKSENKKLGIGSSGASAACAAAAVIATQSDSSDLQEYREQILDLALRAHAAISPQGSGIDVATSVIGGVLEFQRENNQPTWQSIRKELAIPMLVVWTGSSASTDQLLQRVHQAREQEATKYAALMHEMVETSAAFSEALRTSDLSTLTHSADKYALLMRSLGELADAEIWTAPMTTIASIASQFSGTVKPSGAGGGDIVLAFFPDFASAVQCYVALSNAQFKCLASLLGGPGVKFD